MTFPVDDLEPREARLRVALLASFARASAVRVAMDVVYRGRRGALERFRLEPDGVAFRDGRWVVAGRRSGDPDQRVFFVNRMVTARVTRSPARPRPLRERAAFAMAELRAGGLPAVELSTIRVKAPLAAVAASLLPGALCEAESDDSAVCHLRGVSLAPLKRLVGSLGTAARLIRR